MESSSFNLLRTALVLQRRWKTILVFMIVCAAVATVTVFVVPRCFRSTATLVPGNSALADKGRLFNENIKDLYSYFGNGNDLDRILGIANRQATFTQLVDEFSLIDYYKMKGDSLPVLRKKAAVRLEKDISIKKTEEGEIKIVSWTKDKHLSANLINRMIAIIGQTGKDIFEKNYQDQVKQLDSSLAGLQQEYISLQNGMQSNPNQQLAVLKQQQLQERIQNFSRIKDEFKLAAKSLPPVLYVTEPALPAAFGERPDRPAVIIAATLLAFVFGCIVVLINDRKTTA